MNLRRSSSGFAQIVFILIIVTVAIGGAYYFGTLRNKTSLVSVVQTSTPAVSVEPVTKPTVKPTFDPMADWKIYTNTEFSFRYPRSWSVDGKRIFSVGKTIEIWASTSQDPLFNECMKLDSIQKNDSLTVKTFSGTSSSEMCDPANLNKKEKWIVKPEGEGFQPGIQYLYKVDDLVAEKIFDQILSTFKFTE